LYLDNEGVLRRPDIDDLEYAYKENFTKLLAKKFAEDFFQYNLLSSPTSYRINLEEVDFVLNKPEWRWENREVGSHKKGVRLHMVVSMEEDYISMNLKCTGYSRTRFAEYESYWTYVVDVCKRILQTMELRVESLEQAVKFLQLNRAVAQTTFLDVFSDTRGENLPLLLMYNQNIDYIEYLQKKTTLELNSVDVNTEWEETVMVNGEEIRVPKRTTTKTFNLETLINFLNYGLFSKNVGFIAH